MKFAMGQSVFYMHRDQIKTGPVNSRIAVEHQDDGMADLEMISNSSVLFMSKHGAIANDSGNYYTVGCFIYPEHVLAASKQELAQQLVDAPITED